MNDILNKLISDDFIWTAITSHIPGRSRTQRGGGIEINCPVCNDYKPRCGIKRQGVGVVISCFNCGFKTGWSTGRILSHKLRKFLRALGMTATEVSRLNYKAFSHREILKTSPDASLYVADFALPRFDAMSLPKKAKSLSDLAAQGCTEPDFLDAVAYIASRGEAVSNYDYFWSPIEDHQMNRRIIIPCYYENRIVGYSARAIDKGNSQRYTMHAPANYLFNSASISNPLRKYIILAEGILDAVALDCVGLLGARLNIEQIAWIKNYGKTVILIPDQDKRGQELIDVAMTQNWHVAFPRTGTTKWWDEDIKDPAAATQRYGRLWTTLSIIETATNNNMVINHNRKTLTK